jgi:hypothetical protein
LLAYRELDDVLALTTSGGEIGAAAVAVKGEVVHPDELPAAFAILTAAEIEDCLCIYKDELRDGGSRSRISRQLSACHPSRTALRAKLV